MKKMSLVFVVACLVAACFAIGCGGGGGGSANPAATVSADGARASLTGVVTLQGNPLSNAAVYLYKSEKAHMAGISKMSSLRASVMAQQVVNADGSYQTTTNADGRFNFVDVPVGEYTLIAVQDENHQYAETGIRLGMIAEVNPVLTPTGKIFGHVAMQDADQTPVAGALVYLEGTSYVALTGIDGNFTLSNVPANREYTLMVSSAAGTMPAARAVMASPGVETEVTPHVALMPVELDVAIVMGSITSTELESLDGVVVIMLSEYQDIWATITNSAGEYRFAVEEPGVYQLAIGFGDYYANPKSQVVEVIESDIYTVPTFEVFSTRTPEIEMAEVGGWINKLQLAPGDAGGAGVPVTLIGEDAITRVTEVSGEAGEFRFEVLPGTYTLVVGGFYRLPDATPAIEIVAPHFFSQAIDVVPNANIPGSAEINITLAAASPSTAPDTVNLFPVECALVYQGADREYKQLRIAESNLLVFYDVPPGDYKVIANSKHRGFDGESAVFTVVSGEPAAAALEVTFVAPHITSGEPIVVSDTGFLLLNAVNLTADVKGIVNGQPFAPASILTDSVEFNLSALPPGQHKIELFDEVRELKSRTRMFAKNLRQPYEITGPDFKDWNRVTGEWDEVVFTWKSDRHASFDEIWVETDTDPAMEVHRSTIVSAGEIRTQAIKGIKPDMGYTVYIKSHYGGTIVSPDAVAPIASTPAPAINHVALGYDGTHGYSLFGFEVTDTHYYVGFVNAAGPLIYKFLHGGAIVADVEFLPVETTYTPTSMTSDQNGNLYVIYTDSVSNTSNIRKLDANLGQLQDVVINHTIVANDYAIQNAELKMIGNDLYLTGTVMEFGVTDEYLCVGYRFAGGDLSAATNFYESTSYFFPSTSALDLAIVADGNNMLLVQHTGSEFELYRFAMNDVLDAAGPLNAESAFVSRWAATGASMAGIGELAVDSTYLYFRNSGGAGSQRISKSSGYVSTMVMPNLSSIYSSFVVDHRGRLWVAEKDESGSYDYPPSSYLLIGNDGKVSAHYPVFQLPATESMSPSLGRSYIKVNGSTVHMLDIYEDPLQASMIGGLGVYRH